MKRNGGVMAAYQRRRNDISASRNQLASWRGLKAVKYVMANQPGVINGGYNQPGLAKKITG
jgi:hypothetical protein